MPKNYNQVREEWLQFQADNPDVQVDLPKFAKHLDILDATPGERQAAYEDGTLKQINAFIDRGFEQSHVPEMARIALGTPAGVLDKLTGLNTRPTVEAVAGELPRMMVESAATIPAAAVSGPVGPVAIWANRLNKLRQAVGYGSTFARGTANTDSLVGGAIDAASMGLANKLLLPKTLGGKDIGGEAAAKIRSWLSNEVDPTVVATGKNPLSLPPSVTIEKGLKQALPSVAGVTTDAGTVLALNEATRQAEMSVGPNKVAWNDPARNPLTEENVVGQTVGALGFVPQVVSAIRNRPTVEFGSAKQLRAWQEERKAWKKLNQKEYDSFDLNNNPTWTPEQYMEQYGTLDGYRTPLSEDYWKDWDVSTLGSNGKPVPVTEKQFINARIRALKVHVDALAQQSGNGDVEAADRTRGQIAEIIQSLERSGVKDPDVTKLTMEASYHTPTDKLPPNVVSSLGESVASAIGPNAPKSIVDLASFTERLNQVIDFINDNTTSFDEMQKTPETQAQGQWHPNARSSIVVEQLRAKGLLKKVSMETYDAHYTKAFEEFGSPEMATQVALQRTANEVLDELPAALEKSKKMQVETSKSKGVVKADADMTTFIDALMNLPEDVRQGFIDRTADIASRQPITGISGNTKGRDLSPWASWRQDVINAASSYDSATGNVLIYGGKKKTSDGKTIKTFKEVPIEHLILRDENGDYLHDPRLSPVPLAEGGKGFRKTKGKTIIEGSLDRMDESGRFVTHDVPDTGNEMNDLQTALAEGRKRMGLAAEADKLGEVGANAGETSALGTPLTGEVSTEGNTGGKAQSDYFTAQATLDKVKNVLDILTPDELYKVVGNLFRKIDSRSGKEVTDVSADRRKMQLGLGIKAALEDWKVERNPGRKTVEPVGPAGQAFLALRDSMGLKRVGSNERQHLAIALRDLFKSQTPLEGATAPRDTWHEVRVGEIVKRLTRDTVVDDVRNYNIAKMSEHSTTGWDRSEDYERTFTQGAPTYGAEGNVVPKMVDYFSKWVDKHLGAAGYSGETRQFYKQIATALLLQLDKSTVQPYSSVTHSDAAGQAGMERLDPVNPKTTPVRGELRIDFSGFIGKTPEEAVTHLLGTLSHEIRHINDWIAAGYLTAPDAFSEWQRVHVLNLRRLAETLTDDQRNTILETMNNAFANGSVQARKNGLIYGSHDPLEFSAQVHSLLDRALLAPAKDRKSLFEILTYGPQEIKDYANGQYRAYYDVIDSVLQGIRDPELVKIVKDMGGVKGSTIFDPLTGRKDFKFIGEMLGAAANAAKEGSQLGREGALSLAAAQNYLATLSAGAAKAPPVAIPKEVTQHTHELIGQMRGQDLQLPAAVSSTASEAHGLAQDVIYQRVKDPNTRQGLWARWFYPFSNLMSAMEKSGVPLARPLAELSLNLQAGVKRTMSELLNPLLVRQPDGSFKLDSDHLLLQKLAKEKNGRWRTAFNDLSAWQQQALAEIPVFVKDAKGNIIVNPENEKAQAQWDRVRKNLSEEDQQVVPAAMVAFDEIGQLASGRMIATLQRSNAYRVAALLMAGNKKTMTWDVALTKAEIVQKAFMEGNINAVQHQIGSGPDFERVSLLLTGPEGLIEKSREVAVKLQNRKAFRTESLPGEYVVQFRKPGAGDSDLSYLSAGTEHQANYLARKLRDEGNTIVGEIATKKELSEKRGYVDYDAPDQILNKFLEIERTAWDKHVEEMTTRYGEEFGASLQEYSPGETIQKDIATRGMNKFLVKRESKVDRTRFDYIDATMQWVNRLSTSMEYRLAKQHKDLILADPRAKLFPSLREAVDPHFQNLMEPSGEGAKLLRTFTSAYMMGGSLASALVNGTQSLTVLIPVLIHTMKEGGPGTAYGRLARAIGTASDFSFSDRWQKVAAAAEARDKVGTTWSEEESKAVFYKRNIADGGITHGVILGDLLSGTDTKTLMASKFGHGDYGPVTKGELAKDALYFGSQLALKPFGWVEAQNNKVALFAGLEQGYKEGLRGDQLYEYAKNIKTLSTFGGGKANTYGAISKLSSPYSRSAIGVISTLQQYGFGTVATYAQQMKDALGLAPNLTVQERRQAQKAFATMFTTQVALGGALGLPFVGAALTALESVFGVPANQLVREGLASLGRSDDEDSTGMGAAFAETSLNGIANQMFGLDVSSRVGVSSILGTSSYRGFNLQDMAGPTVSVAANLVNGLSLFAQGQPEKAAKMLVPNAFKNAVEMKTTKDKFGDYGMRDSGGNLLYQPTQSEVVGYMAGFRPRVLSEKRQAQQLMLKADERATMSQGREYDKAANALLQGDTSAAMRLGMDARFNDPTVDPKDVYRSIVKQATDSMTVKDLLASGKRGSEGDRKSIAGTFGPEVITRQSELQKAMTAMQLGMQLGLAPDPQSLRKAALMDALIQQRGMPRSEASRLVEFLHQ